MDRTRKTNRILIGLIAAVVTFFGCASAPPSHSARCEKAEKYLAAAQVAFMSAQSLCALDDSEKCDRIVGIARASSEAAELVRKEACR